VTANSLEALKNAIDFKPQGDRAGNVTAGRGTLGGRALRVGLVENRFASGAIGADESERLVAMFKVAALEHAPVVLHLDSAGAKVSEGLKALGSFRALFHAGLDFAATGTPIVAVLGKNCYGGSSMLAHLASHRLFNGFTQLAMTGPAILAAQAGMNALDEAFRAMAEAAMSPAARSRANPANTVWNGEDLGAWLASAIAGGGLDAVARHVALGARLKEKAPAPEAVQRRDLEKIYPEGYEATEDQGVLEGVGRRDGHAEAFIGLVNRKPVGASRAWRFAEHVWRPTLRHLADRIATRLRAKSWFGYTVTVRVRFRDMSSVTRSMSIESVTNTPLRSARTMTIRAPMPSTGNDHHETGSA